MNFVATDFLTSNLQGFRNLGGLIEMIIFTSSQRPVGNANFVSRLSLLRKQSFPLCVPKEDFGYENENKITFISNGTVVNYTLSIWMPDRGRA